MTFIPAGLHRTYGAHHLHFITCSCYHRRPRLRTPRSRDRVVSILEETRQRYRFVVVGYVIPELPPAHHRAGGGYSFDRHASLEQRTAHALLPKKKRTDPRQRSLFAEDSSPPFWQARFYDFNVWTTRKRVEKLRYMHRNPVKRGLVGSPEEWRWSSYRFYWLDEPRPVRIDEGWGKISFVPRVA